MMKNTMRMARNGTTTIMVMVISTFAPNVFMPRMARMTSTGCTARKEVPRQSTFMPIVSESHMEPMANIRCTALLEVIKRQGIAASGTIVVMENASAVRILG